MNGPQHYAEAERLLGGDELDIAAAQVHATLAVAAAAFAGGQWADAQNGAIVAGAEWHEVLS